MTNPSEAPRDQQPQHQAPVSVEAAEEALATFGQPQEKQDNVPVQAPGQPEDGGTTLADELLSESGAEGSANVLARLQERSEQLPTLMGYSLASEAHVADPTESPRPQLFLDQVSTGERKKLTPNDVLLLPDDLILNATDEFISTLPKPVQKAWREEAAEHRDELSQWTPRDVENLVEDGHLHEMPDEVAQYLPDAAQKAWVEATGRPISPAPFENSPVGGPAEQPKGKRRFGWGRNKDTATATQEAEPVAADNSADNAQETTSADRRFSEADGIDKDSVFYGKSEEELIDEIFDMSDKAFSELSAKERAIYQKVEDYAYELSEARASNPDREMVGPESDPGLRAKAAALAGKVAAKLNIRRGKKDNPEQAVTSKNYRVSAEDADGLDFLVGMSAAKLLEAVSVEQFANMNEHDKKVVVKLQAQVRALHRAEQQAAAEAENEPTRIKKITAALGGVASKAGNLVRRDRNGEESGEQGEQQPKRPLKERAKEHADAIIEALKNPKELSGKVLDGLNTAKGQVQLAIAGAVLALPKIGQDLYERFTDVDMATGKRVVNEKGKLFAAVASGAALVAVGASMLLGADQKPETGGAGNTVADPSTVPDHGAGGTSSSEVTTTTGVPSSSEAADATTTTGTPSSSTEVETTTTGTPSSSVDSTEAAGPTGGNTSTTEVDTTTTGTPSSSTEVDTTTTGTSTPSAETDPSQAGNPGNVGAGEHAIDADTTTTTGSPSSSSAEQTTGASPTIDDRQPHNGGTTPSPEAPDASDAPDTPDQTTPEPGAPQAPDARGMDQVADPANQPAYSPGVSELQPGGNVWDSSEQFWVDRGFKGSPDDLNKLTDAMKDWRLEQMGVSEADAVNLRPGTPLPMPTPDQISEIIARSGV